MVIIRDVIMRIVIYIFNYNYNITPGNNIKILLAAITW